MENGLNNVFAALEPKQHNEILSKLKSGFIDILLKKLSQYCNDEEIKRFKEVVLTEKLGEFKIIINTAFGSANIIEKGGLLHTKIANFQSMGGEKFLTQTIQQFNSNYLNDKELLNNLESIKVKKCDPIGNKRIYNLTTSKTHTYVTNGFIS